MSKGKGSPDQTPSPAQYPNTTPPSPGGGDNTGWVMTSIGRLEATVAGFHDQLNRIESKLTDIDRKIEGHGKWIHTLQVLGGIILLLLGWIFVNAVWPVLRAKLGIPDTPKP